MGMHAHEWRPVSAVEGVINMLLVVEMFLLAFGHICVWPPGEFGKGVEEDHSKTQCYPTTCRGKFFEIFRFNDSFNFWKSLRQEGLAGRVHFEGLADVRNLADPLLS